MFVPSGGWGTFVPVKTETTDRHVMHAEWAEVGDNAATAISTQAKVAGRSIAEPIAAAIGLVACAVVVAEAEPWVNNSKTDNACRDTTRALVQSSTTAVLDHSQWANGTNGTNMSALQA